MRLFESGIIVGVTLYAHGMPARANHVIGWVLDVVIAVAGDAAGESHGGKRIFVRALLEKLCLEYVAVGADIGHVGDTRRRGPVISVTGGAGGRGALRSPRTAMASR